jgi:hypothetical protein
MLNPKLIFEILPALGHITYESWWWVGAFEGEHDLMMVLHLPKGESGIIT